MSTTKQECDAPAIEPVSNQEQATTEVPAIGELGVPFKRTLRCDLTESELVEVAQEICKTQREIDDLAEAKRASAASYAERIKNRTQEREELMLKFSSRSENRVVDCKWRLNFPEAGMKTGYRLDTNDAIGVETMTTEDLDQDIPGIVEDEIPESEDETDSDEEEFYELADNARVDAIIDGLKDDEEAEPKGDF